MRGQKPFQIPQIPKRRTLSPATGHDRDRHRSRSRSRTSQRSTGSKASRRSRPSESPEYSPSDRGRKSRRSSPPERRSPRRRSPPERINGPFAIERGETAKKIFFELILFLDLFQYKNHIWHINKNFIFLAVSPFYCKGPK